MYLCLLHASMNLYIAHAHNVPTFFFIAFTKGPMVTYILFTLFHVQMYTSLTNNKCFFGWVKIIWEFMGLWKSAFLSITMGPSWVRCSWSQRVSIFQYYEKHCRKEVGKSQPTGVCLGINKVYRSTFSKCFGKASDNPTCNLEELHVCNGFSVDCVAVGEWL